MHNKQKCNIIVCSYLLAKQIGYNVGCHNNVIAAHKKMTIINNDYTFKQYIILMCVHTYRLNKWNIALNVNIL